MCGTCHRCGQVSQFLFIAPFPDNRQKFTQCRLPNSTLHASKLSERERDKEGPRFISLSRIIPSQILMGLAHLGRSLRWAARKYGCRRLKCLNHNNQERRGVSERAAHYTTMFVRPPSRFLRYRSVRVAPAVRPRKMTWSTWMDLS